MRRGLNETSMQARKGLVNILLEKLILDIISSIVLFFCLPKGSGQSGS